MAPTTRRAVLTWLSGLAVAGACSEPASERRQTSTPTTTRARRPPDPPARATPETPTDDATTLPRGGRTVFPEFRLVGYVGGRTEAFGRLYGDLDERLAELEERFGTAYAGDRTVQPVAELVTFIALDHPGPEGLYRAPPEPELIDDYLAAARRHRALLLLNVQPGRADFLDEVRGLESWLTEPDVGVALDPEWAVGTDQVPGDVFGQTTGVELAEVAAYLADLVATHDLPEKVMVVHQLSPSIVQSPERLRDHAGVVPITSVDGIGAAEDKVKTWRRVQRRLPDFVHRGFKLFFDEDTRHGPLMTPAEVLALDPTPEYVMYE